MGNVIEKPGLEQRASCSVIVLLACGVLVCTDALAVTPVIPRYLAPGTLPQYKVNSTDFDYSATNTLTIRQKTPSAIYNWESFDIGKDGTVNFIQPSASAIALNRIFDSRFSQIDGKLTANGQIYLINTNGIMFNKGASVNVNTMVASALDIPDEKFIAGIGNITNNPAFADKSVFSGGTAGGFVQVEAGDADHPAASLAAATGGKIMLFAPNVQNNGVITTPDGQTILAAGSKVYLTVMPETYTDKVENKSSLLANLRGMLVEVDNGGQVDNLNLGKIIAERGNVTLIGLAVNQAGRISATTSVNANGSIRLLAQDTAFADTTDTSAGTKIRATHTGTVTLASGSVTEVTPDLNDKTASPDEQQFNPSMVEVVGHTISMQGNSRIVANGGQVMLTALENPSLKTPFKSLISPYGAAQNSSRIYLDSGSLIDVSGTPDVLVPIERNLIQVELRGSELKDSPLQRNSFLYGKTITVDVRKGTPLVDYSGKEKLIGRTVAERTADGGTVKLNSEGDIVTRKNSVIDLSGGSLSYQAGYINTTKLISKGKVYDISEASPDITYDGFAGMVTRQHTSAVSAEGLALWNVTQTWEAPQVMASRGQYTQGYSEGKNAGTAQFIAPALVLNGDIESRVKAGLYQRQPVVTDTANALYKTLYNLLPQGGVLKIGDDDATDINRSSVAKESPDYKTPDVSIVADSDMLPDDFREDSSLPAERANHLQLSSGLIGEDKISKLEVYSTGKIDMPAGVTLAAPGGSVKLVGAEVDVAGDIVMPSGSIALTARNVLGQSGKAVTVSGLLDAHGYWVNDFYPGSASGAMPGALLINGGAINIESAMSGVSLLAGSMLDVSGGGWVNAGGKLAGKGNAGSITMKSGSGLVESAGFFNDTKIELNGSLSGYALGKGGSLDLSTGRVRIGGIGQAGELALSVDFFSQGGFATYKIKGVDGLTVSENETVEAKAESVVLSPVFIYAPSTGSMADFSRHEMLPQFLRKPVSLTLSADSLYQGNLRLEQGSTVRVDPQGSISLIAGRQMTIDGTVDAPAGPITLGMLGLPGSESDQKIGFLSNQSIWLGKSASLLSRGFDSTQLDNKGVRQGEVLGGGKISFAFDSSGSGKGYVVAESGSVMDVSGTSGTVDVLQPSANVVEYKTQAVASDAGSITVQTREGTLLDGTMLGKAGGAGAQGGRFSLQVDTNDNPSEKNPVVVEVNPYPLSSRQVVLSQSGSFIPAGLKAGDAIDSASYNGKGMVAADSLMNGGFSQVTLKAQDAVHFEGDVTLQTGRSIHLDAPNIAASDGANINLRSGYLSIGNSDIRYQQKALAAQAGSAGLSAQADWIDLQGNVSLNGFSRTALTSANDIRLNGVWNSDSTNPALIGKLSSWGDLTLTARQVYPTTLSRFILEVADTNPDGQLHIEANGTDAPVLSAAGQLTLSAPSILQEGVLKAPLGQIVFAKKNSLTLGANSITSVSAEGQSIPFGVTSNGKDWQYAFDTSANKIFTAPPEKMVYLGGQDVTVQSGARIDISGGGDLLAYEFFAGPPGLSTDKLAGNDYYAVLPGMKDDYAPFDPLYYQGSNLKPGDSVYLSGADGLAAGVYPLLPAHYALLPGAFLVKPVSGHRDMLPQNKLTLANGSNIVPGYLTVTNQANEVARYAGFSVRPAAGLMKEADYKLTSANAFFADKALADGAAIPRLPVDAGKLVMSIGNRLALNGQPLKTDSQKGRGAVVDIEAVNLWVGDGSNVAGYVSLDAASLSGFGAESLLLGGTRSTVADGQQIGVTANKLVVANGTGNALKAPEVILAASDTLIVESGSVIQGSGTASAAQDLIVGRGGDSGAGDGALLRASSAGYAGVKRENTLLSKGTLQVQENVLLQGKSIALDATLETASKSGLQVDGGSLSLAARQINLGDTDGLASGFSLPNTLLAGLGNLDSLYLKSYSSIDMHGNVAIGGSAANPTINYLSLDTAALRGYGDAGKTATFAAVDVMLRNSNGTDNAAAVSAGTTLRLEGQHSVTLGEGNQHVSGFAGTTLASGGEIIGQRTGTLQVDGDLSLQAARITASSGADQKWTATGVVSTDMPATASTLAAAEAMGAKLEISGKRIDHRGDIELPAGVVKLAATGAEAGDSVTLAAGSKVSVAGISKTFGDTTEYAPGGGVDLTSAKGDVAVQAGATVDVSAGGRLAVNASNGQAIMVGVLKGNAQNGFHQGSYTQDSKTLADFSALNAALEAGGFGERRDIRVRQGDVEIAASDVVKARHFTLAADTGKIDVKGQVNASDGKGGDILIAAMDDVTLYDGSSLKAQGSSSHGGKVELSTVDGMLDVRSGAKIDVSGASADASQDGGHVVLRAPRTANDVAMQLGSSAISGAKEVVAEAVKVYGNISSIGTATGSGKLNTATVKSETASFMANAAAVEARLGNNAKLQAGIEVRSAGDLALSSDWDLSAWRFGSNNRPVMLTLRAAGDMNLSGSLSDGFTTATTSGLLKSGASSSYRLVGGADMSAANPLAVLPMDDLASNKGNVTVAAGKIVRTGTGNIAISAGRNIKLSDSKSVVYTAGESADVLPGFTAPASSNYAKNGGNLAIFAQGNINGVGSTQLITEWLHRQGQLNSIKYQPSWWIRYDQFQQGVGALGGGDVEIVAGGNIDNISAVAPTTGRVSGSSPATANTDVQGGGDLTVRAGGDIRSGVFYVARGHGELTAGGGIVTGGKDKKGHDSYTVLALGDGDFRLNALGNIQLGTVMNPTVYAQGSSQKLPLSATNTQKSFFFTYTPDSQVSLLSTTGDIVLKNNIADLNTLTDVNYSTSSKRDTTGSTNSLNIYPGSLAATAMTGNVAIDGDFSLFPSAQGNLSLLAGNSITTKNDINMPDVDPSQLPGIMTPVSDYRKIDSLITAFAPHAARPVHNNDSTPVRMVAVSGDIIAQKDAYADESIYYFPKQAYIEAGRDIIGLSLRGQNLRANDLTRVRAGRDVTYISPRADSTNGLKGNFRQITLGGPGRLELSAGRNIDLGNSYGVTTMGNKDNPALPGQGAGITLLAGVSGGPDYQGFAARYGDYRDANGNSYDIGDDGGYSKNLAYAFFDQLNLAGQEHNSGKDGVVGEDGAVMGYQRGYDAIASLFPAKQYKGDLSMAFSQIKTLKGGDIDIFTPGGMVSAGLASVPVAVASSKDAVIIIDEHDPSKNLVDQSKLAGKVGIVTMAGGNVRAVSKGDFQVNSSRVFTLYGNDILLWSSEGNIDAGKGAKSAISAPPPVITTDAKGNTVTEYQGAVTGSGIRAMITGGNAKPEDVMVSLIAPKGEVNAGDAGIGSVGNVTLAAQRVTGADNIQVGGISSGVPVGGTGSVGAGVAGVSGLGTEAGKAGTDAAQAIAAQQKRQENFKPPYVNVEVISLGE